MSNALVMQITKGSDSILSATGAYLWLGACHPTLITHNSTTSFIAKQAWGIPHAWYAAWYAAVTLQKPMAHSAVRLA